MKRNLFFMIILFLLSACHKDKEENNNYERVINGTLTDAISNEAIPGIPMYILYASYDIHCQWGFCGMEILDKDTTDDHGNFRLAYTVSSDFDNNLNVNLKIGTVPAGYQYGARINGKYCKAYCPETVNQDEAFLRNGAFYKVELIPNTYASFVKPAIPAGWENDTLYLKIENLQKFDVHGTLCGANAEFYFPLKKAQSWQDLAQPRLLYLGDQLDISYRIRNGILKKSGTFGKKCSIGQVNAIELPFW